MATRLYLHDSPKPITSTLFTTGTGFNSYVSTAVLQPDGKIIVGGGFTSYNGVTQNYITRLNPDGTRDTTFAPTGTGFNNQVYSIALQSDGKILVGGQFTLYNGVAQNYVTRLNTDGTRDTSFTIGTGFAGTVAGITAVTSLIVQTDGKILAGGYFTSYNGTTQNSLTRLNTDGTRDTGFTIGTGFNAEVQTILQQSNGKILVGGGFTTYNGVTQNYITRLNADGTRDTGSSLGTAFAGGSINSLAQQSDGKILIGGQFTTYNGVAQGGITRANTDDTRDTGFTIGTGFDSLVDAITQQTDGKILVGGYFTTYNGVTQNRITRLNANGTRDTGFTISTGFNNNINSIAVQADGKILVGGNFTSYNDISSDSRTYFIRLDADGTYPLTGIGFNSGGTGFNNSVSEIILQTDNKILVIGSFSTYNGFAVAGITRLNADGTRDTAFNPGTSNSGSLAIA